MTDHLPKLPDSDTAARAADLVVQAPGSEQRWSNRTSTVLAGNIISDQLAGRVSCVVRDLSASGGLIELSAAKGGVIASAAGLPDTFALILLRDNSEVRCQVMWRQPTAVGVRFLGGFKALPTARDTRKAKAPAKRSWF
jgi:hypothetical protein